MDRPRGLARADGAAWLVAAATVGANLTPGDLGLLLLLLPAAAGGALTAAAALVAAARLLPAMQSAAACSNTVCV